MANLIPLGILEAITRSRLFATWTSAAMTGTVLQNLAAAYTSGGTEKFQSFGSLSTGTTTNIYKTSATGANGSWTSRTLPVTTEVIAAASSSTRTVFGRNSNSTLLYYSDNGTSWTSVTAFTNSSPTKKIIHDGTRFWAIAENNSPFYSSDGAAYTAVATIGTSFQSIGFSAERATYILVEAGSASTTNKRCTGDPTNSANWSNVTIGSSSYEDIAGGNDIWVAIEWGTTAYRYSVDNGVTWATGTLPGSPLDNTRVQFFNGYFYYGRLNRIYYSQDGINWTTITTTGDVAARVFVNDGTNLYAFGNANNGDTGTNDYMIGS